jgi:hypothetical protein
MGSVRAPTSDRRLLVITGVFLALAGLLFAGVVLIATNGDAPAADANKPLFLGLRDPLTSSIKDGGPLYFANPFGDDGFWVDLEDGRLVAYILKVPGVRDCSVKWKAQENSYLDCHRAKIDRSELARYNVTIGSRNGTPKTSVFVDLHAKIPAGTPLSPS